MYYKNKRKQELAYLCLANDNTNKAPSPIFYI